MAKVFTYPQGERESNSLESKIGIGPEVGIGNLFTVLLGNTPLQVVNVLYIGRIEYSG